MKAWGRVERKAGWRGQRGTRRKGGGECEDRGNRAVGATVEGRGRGTGTCGQIEMEIGNRKDEMGCFGAKKKRRWGEMG